MTFFAKKSLGQNFLTSEGAVKKIVDAGDLKQGETVLEIGPGKGVLTKKLLEAGVRVVAIEKDRRLIEILREAFQDAIASNALTLLEGDVLKTDLRDILPQKYKVIANIPYYITGELIRFFLAHTHQPEHVVFLAQKEVVDRIIANDNKESILSLSVKAYGDPKKAGVIKAGSFQPKPKVDSAILVIAHISKKRFEGVSEETFFKIVKTGFSNKRKQLHKNLQTLLADPQKTLEQCGIDPHTRAENLSFTDWLHLSKTMSQQ